MVKPLSLLVVGALLAPPRTIHAEESQASSEADAATRSVARELGRQGIELYRAGSFAAALDKLTRAHALVGLTTTALWRARCLVQLGRLVEGSEALFEVTRMALPADARPVHVEAQREAAKERDALLPRIPRLVIEIDGELPSDTVVSVDGAMMPPALLGVKQPLDPGKHVVEVRGGEMTAQRSIELDEGQVLAVPIRLVDRSGTTTRELSLDADNVHDGSPWWQVGWVAVGLGGAGLVVGAVTGGLALGKRDSLDESCPDRACAAAFHEDVDAFESLRLASNVSFIAGGVLAALGVTFVIVGAASGGPSAEVHASCDGLVVEGAF